MEAAIGLFATYPIDEVTVGDIAAAADMTSAAVYYHFASKEQILLTGLGEFVDRLLDEARRAASVPDAVPSQVISATLTWIRAQGTPAVVYFIASAGLNMHLEALRRDTRFELNAILQPVITAARPDANRAEVGVIATALVSLLETASAAWLSEDVAFRGLGARRFPTEVVALADRITGAS